ncbi:MAG TPA: OmpH family outer membrane protein [Bryobacteraceae bacterium]|nr:OmpH family outer membrane protein [Bryobacteraceae bacterium]
MNSTLLVLAGLALAAFSADAQTPGPGKVGVINIQSAIVSTKDGQKAANDIQTRFNPKKADLDRRQSEIGQMQDQLNRGRNTLSEDARTKLVRDIDQKTKSLNRDTEDARSELDQEEQKIMSELGGRIMAVIDKYAKDNGYSLILDVSSPQTPVLYASNAIDITKEIIELYDKNAPAAVTPPPSAAPGASAITRPAAPKPVAPPKAAPPKVAPPK